MSTQSLEVCFLSKFFILRLKCLDFVLVKNNCAAIHVFAQVNLYINQIIQLESTLQKVKKVGAHGQLGIEPMTF